jgi:hypothetical protein
MLHPDSEERVKSPARIKAELMYLEDNSLKAEL